MTDLHRMCWGLVLTVSGTITSLPKWCFAEGDLMVQLLEQMILYQHDKFNCPCSWPSLLSKADCDGLKPLFADSTLSALYGVCRLNQNTKYTKYSSSVRQEDLNVACRSRWIWGKVLGHCKTRAEQWLCAPSPHSHCTTSPGYHSEHHRDLLTATTAGHVPAAWGMVAEGPLQPDRPSLLNLH